MGNSARPLLLGRFGEWGKRMEFDVRFGEADDIDIITRFILEAGSGLFDYLLDGVVPGSTTEDLIKFAVADPDNVLNFNNALLAFAGSEPAGMILSYPSADYGIPAAVDAMVPAERLDRVREIFTNVVPDSWYINSLTVAEVARGQGLARLLIDLSADLAVEKGLNSLCLHAWADNKRALKVYRNCGFELVKTIPVEPTTHFDHPGGMLLLKANLPLAR